MKKMKIYISGPITGTTDYLERFAFTHRIITEQFQSAEVVNPVDITAHLPEGSHWGAYMDLCVKALKSCTHIHMMDGWESSRGATVEFFLAKDHGLVFL